MNVFGKITVLILVIVCTAQAQTQDPRKIKASDAIQGNLPGVVKSIREFVQEEGGDKILKTEQTFNKAGDWLEIKQYDAGKLAVLTRYHYDPISGSLASYERLDPQGNVLLTAACSFDAAQRKLICVFKSPDGKAKGQEEVSYNEKGMETGSKQTDAAGKLVNSCVVQRDSTGKPSHMNFSVPNHENYMESEYLWDSKGCEVSKVTQIDGKKTERVFSGVKFDSTGNWIERSVKSTGETADPIFLRGNGPQLSVETRVIEYYPQ